MFMAGGVVNTCIRLCASFEFMASRIGFAQVGHGDFAPFVQVYRLGFWINMFGCVDIFFGRGDDGDPALFLDRLMLCGIQVGVDAYFLLTKLDGGQRLGIAYRSQLSI